MAGEKWPPKDVHVLISRTCDYAPLCGKRDFSSVITQRLWKWEIIWDYPGGLNVITGVLIRGRQEGQSHRRRCDHGRRGSEEMGQHLTAGFEGGGRGQESRRVGTGEGQETNYPLELSRGTQACRPLDFSPLKCILGFGPPKL